MLLKGHHLILSIWMPLLQNTSEYRLSLAILRFKPLAVTFLTNYLIGKIHGLTVSENSLFLRKRWLLLVNKRLKSTPIMGAVSSNYIMVLCILLTHVLLSSMVQICSTFISAENLQITLYTLLTIWTPTAMRCSLGQNTAHLRAPYLRYGMGLFP